jgi:membrane-bound lytic murein transglycosylase B
LRLGAPTLAAVLLGACAHGKPARPPADDAWIVARPEVNETPAPKALEPLPLDHCSATEEGFDRWMEGFRRHAREQGISPKALATIAALAYDPGVIALDRAQKPFKLSFAEFAAKRVTPDRVARGRRELASHAALLARVVERFGVHAEILVAIWGLETDYGANAGSISSLGALATLAFDCRRAGRFRGELLSALRILDHGDLGADELFGAWAGELGQTQFLPSSYLAFGVDFDGDGRVDMVRSAADALASTASYLKGHGWRAGEPYAPGSANFDALREWNASEIYRKTIVLFAEKLVRR